MAKTLTLRTLDGRTFSGNIKNPAATLGSVAARVAELAGLAGAYETVDPKTGLALDPNTTLADLPEGELVVASDLTPARSSGG
ncbi:MAG: hypothetical protein JXB46_03760 [Candidatus Eisenbacteria bacterium]|nr:hypothetical protein [Candidatus Eisenbacteria bacterium]